MTKIALVRDFTSLRSNLPNWRDNVQSNSIIVGAFTIQKKKKDYVKRILYKNERIHNLIYIRRHETLPSNGTPI